MKAIEEAARNDVDALRWLEEHGKLTDDAVLAKMIEAAKKGNVGAARWLAGNGMLNLDSC